MNNQTQPSMWTLFSPKDGPTDYIKPIFDAAKPYAVVRTVGVGYAVTGADSIEHASVISDAVLQEFGGDPGLRIYLLSNNWICQVHYVGETAWPSHDECVRTVAWSHIAATKRASSVLSFGQDYSQDSARQRQLRAAKAFLDARSALVKP